MKPEEKLQLNKHDLPNKVVPPPLKKFPKIDKGIGTFIWHSRVNTIEFFQVFQHKKPTIF